MGKHTVDVRLFTINDDIALEYDDTVILEFKPLYPEFMEELGRKGEFIRESTVVKIIDNDSKLKVNVIIPDCKSACQMWGEGIRDLLCYP